ncbi:hypothetical protein [Nesterenkonia alkaliphila]|uniref:Uncharacterized protein n=1 Tax=Nesterenkonia alkaliphila TaxID=1463631 RepID=A0A7K1UF65_9MICC|nr:hypothetical protein [Nesterenkonia alkaliphila]MVT25115.1 hypothetical protein [Nesterenkonia alkaliphila]GFZ82828.1 hypothetical protein GCM10011359_09400 [Nesterenkonia alkaliphila]
MYFLVNVEWDLHRHHASLEQLRAWAQGPGATAYHGLPGVVLKAWYSNPQYGVWGAVYLVEDPQALDAERLPRTVADRTGPIGTPPDRVKWHVLEQTVLGGTHLDHVLPPHLLARPAPGFHSEEEN